MPAVPANELALRVPLVLSAPWLPLTIRVISPPSPAPPEALVMALVLILPLLVVKVTLPPLPVADEASILPGVLFILPTPPAVTVIGPLFPLPSTAVIKFLRLISPLAVVIAIAPPLPVIEPAVMVLLLIFTAPFPPAFMVMLPEVVPRLDSVIKSLTLISPSAVVREILPPFPNTELAFKVPGLMFILPSVPAAFKIISPPLPVLVLLVVKLPVLRLPLAVVIVIEPPSPVLEVSTVPRFTVAAEISIFLPGATIDWPLLIEKAPVPLPPRLALKVIDPPGTNVRDMF